MDNNIMIPKNHSRFSNKIQNFIEGVLFIVAFSYLTWLLPFTIAAKLTLIFSLGLSGAVIAFFGYKNRSLGQIFISWIIYKKSRRVLKLGTCIDVKPQTTKDINVGSLSYLEKVIHYAKNNLLHGKSDELSNSSTYLEKKSIKHRDGLSFGKKIIGTIRGMIGL